jgi:Tol biopolymer transport system component
MALVRGPFAALLIAAGSAAAQDSITRQSVDSSGAEGDGDSGLDGRPAITPDGRHVAFESAAANLVSNDANGVLDVFVHDRVTGATVRVSVDSAGAEGDGDSVAPALSEDGRFVAFHSFATNLVSGDTNGDPDVFVHDRDPDGNGVFDEGNGVTTRVSVKSDGGQGNGRSRFPSISGDGSLVVFASDSTNLVNGDSNGRSDVFLHDRGTAATTRVSVDSSGNEGDGDSRAPAIAADGGFVAFQSLATNLVANDTNGRADVLVRDLASSTTFRVSVDSSGVEGDNHSFGPPAITPDGEFVAFYSFAGNLVPFDGNLLADVFVHRVPTGVTTRVSVAPSGNQPNDGSELPAISSSGRFVAFESDASNLVANDANGARDAFVFDVLTATMTMVSANCAGLAGSGASRFVALSADGQLAAFGSEAGDLVGGDTNSVSDVFVRDLTVEEPDASWNNYGAGYPGTNGIPGIAASADPALGESITVDIGSSLGAWTVGFLLVGGDEASIPTRYGGEILVDILFVVPLAVSPVGVSVAADIPVDPALCGLAAHAQAIESDEGATRGISFTPGLKLVFGH